jgi:transglutaminase-like putative cysteine protease
MISLHVLNITVWIALGLLAFAWILPLGRGSAAFYSLWQDVTSPLVSPLEDFGRVFSSIDSKKGGTVHRFGSTLPLQGEISLGGGEVMEVSAAETGFLRAQSYDFYTAQGWKVAASSAITTSAWPASRALQSVDEMRRQFRRPLSIQVTTSKEASVIVSAGQPLAVNIDSRIVFGPDQSDVASIRPANRLGDGTQYRVDSSVTNASVARLRGAPSGPYATWLSPYLQLPQNYSRRVAAKARELASGSDNNYDKAVAIEQHLRTLGVDTKINPAPPNRDSVEYFLFTLGRGYFDYHASAMVVMLRSLGIPARMTVGYIIRPQDRVPDTNTYIVSEANAFAWPEVYFTGLGWVEFNPTPSEPRITRSGSDDQEFFGGIEEEILEEPGLPSDAVTPVDPASPVLDNLASDEGSNLVGRIILTILLLFVGITALAGSIFQYSWQRGLGGLDYPVQVWEKTLRLARWAKIRALPQETPRDIVGRLKRALPEVQDIDYLGETFQKSRYGNKELAPEERERLANVWKNVRNTLLQRLLRWK